MPNIQDLIAQKAELERQIAAAQREARSDAINKVRALMSEYGLSIADLGGRGASSGAAPKSGSTRKVAVKYRDNSGNTWTGRGLKPKWLQAALASGRSLKDFEI